MKDSAQNPLPSLISSASFQNQNMPSGKKRPVRSDNVSVLHHHFSKDKLINSFKQTFYILKLLQTAKGFWYFLSPPFEYIKSG